MGVVEFYRYDQPNKYLLALALTVLSALYYLVYCYELNIPQWDDFSLSLILLWLKGNNDGFPVSLEVLFSQLFEHRLVVYRLLALIDYQLFGQLDFKHLAYLGNSVNVILLILFCKIIKPVNRKPFIALPIILLFLVPLQWVGQAWRNGAGGTYVLAFAGLAFYFSIQSSNLSVKRSLLGIVFSTLAVFTTANGLLVAPVLFAYFIFTRSRNHFILWGLIALAQWGFFFLYDYQMPLSASSSVRIYDKCIFFIASLGSAFAFGNLTIALLVGLILVMSIIFLSLNRYIHENPIVYLFIVFDVLTIAVVAWGRSRFGLDTALSERYTYTSLMTLMLVYIGMQETLLKTNKNVSLYLFNSMAAIALILGLYSCYTGIPSMEEEREKRISFLKQWLTTGEGLRFRATLESDFTLSTLLKAGLYKISPQEILPLNYVHESRSAGLCNVQNDGALQAVYDVIRIAPENSSSGLIRVEGILVQEASTSNPIYVVFNSESEGNRYFPATMVNLEKLELSGLWENASRRRFVVLIPAGYLSKGKYRVGVCDREQLVFNKSQALLADAFAAGLWRVHWNKKHIVEERRGLIDYAQSVTSLEFIN